MFNNLINTDAYHTQSALDIERRVRQREALRQRLDFDSIRVPSETRKILNSRLIAVLASMVAYLFG